MTTVSVRRSPRQHPTPLHSSASLFPRDSSPTQPPASLSRRRSLGARAGGRTGHDHGSRKVCSGRQAVGRAGGAGGSRDRERGADEEDGGARRSGAVGGTAGDSSSLIEQDEADSSPGRASSSSSASPPPSLLSHLSTSPSFAYTPSDPPSTPFTFLAPHPSSPPAPSSASPCACASKRDSSAPSPNPHLGPSPDHLKKRKLRHRFFRSDALFSPPSSPSASSSRPAASAPWWPSVSRQFGDGQESRFGPREEEWTGDGEGWEARLSLRLGRVELDFALEHFALEQEEQQEEQRARTVPPRPAPPPRSNSCPAMLQSHPLPPEAPLVAAEVPLEGPALKQALLRNLRARLASEGGASKAGEAGLRFKKWVVWNAFNRRQRDLALLESDESDIEIEVDSAPSASFGDSSLDGAGSLESSHLLGGMFDVLFDDDGELPTPPGASLLDEQDTFTSSSASEDDPGFGLFSSLLPLPLQPSTAPAPAEGGEEAVPRSFSSSARPGMRRTTSLPNVSLSGLACDSSAAAEVSGGGWGPIQVACEG